MHWIGSGGPGYVDFLRHGQPEGGSRFRGRLDDPLSPLGWEQMWAAVDGVEGWDGIVSSPLTRCAAFAEQLAARRGLPLRLDERLREISFGDWEGQAVERLYREAEAELSRYWADPIANPPPNGEPLPEFRDRIAAVWADLMQEAEGRHLLVVAHGGVIRVLLSLVLEMPLAAVLRLEVPNAALSRVRVQADINGRPSPSLMFHAGGP
ncbi:histidine phosphatase family protein [Alkalilimnicola ehrlichii]|uniref:Histidine phosphatase family protein n=1 Tax=Alkalilimnicola ehrlichii TaxID=351052 RepID=A0A3E0WLV1_9GAMM|nr:alpha-ribazole phosphatase family protein [Alkalilimnicola ehrlichii]RFA26845.1 histidine phosphatase family protein [Alkalilimnicola ehrlichii]RFA33940.1 histidine phosphatase family protein [Alkalilimnicola ehrlichii]